MVKRSALFWIAILIELAVLIGLVVVVFVRGEDAKKQEAQTVKIALDTGMSADITIYLDEEYETETIETETAEEETDYASEIDTAVVDTASEVIETRYLDILPGDGYLDIPLDRSAQNAIKKVSGEYGVPWQLIMAVCYVESGFDPYAVSSHGDVGLMQIAPVNHGWLANDLGITDLFDPEQNVRAGTHILADKIAGSDGDFTAALMKYNRGDAVALEQMREGIYSTEYTEKVLSKYYEYLSYGG